MDLDEALDWSYRMLEGVNWDGYYDRIISRANTVNWKLRNPYIWFWKKNYSTTYSSDKVLLANNWLTWPPKERAANVAHEVVHTFQCDQDLWTNIKWLFSKEQKYLNERQAEEENVRFHVRSGRVPGYETLRWRDYSNPAWAAAQEIIHDTIGDYSRLEETFDHFALLAEREWLIWKDNK